MAVSHEDVRHIAALARLGLEPDRVTLLVGELNGILAHMDALASVDTSTVEPNAHAVTGSTMRSDDAPPIPLARAREDIAPEMRDGFFLVPRLSTHEDGTAGHGADEL